MKLIVITGATRGIGRALAEAFTALGHRVHGCGRGKARVRELNRLHARRSVYRAVDVADEAQVRAWAASILKEGPPDLLVNNAALINRCAPLWKVGADEFDRIIDVNVKGVANAIRHLLPAMVRRRRGVVVNMSSGWGRHTDAEEAPYCATKYAVEGLTKSLAAELPRGMAAVPLSPGCVATDMLRTCFGRDSSSYASPEKWARKAAPFLLSLGPRDNGRSLTVSA